MLCSHGCFPVFADERQSCARAGALARPDGSADGASAAGLRVCNYWAIDAQAIGAPTHEDTVYTDIKASVPLALAFCHGLLPKSFSSSGLTRPGIFCRSARPFWPATLAVPRGA